MTLVAGTRLGPYEVLGPPDIEAYHAPAEGPAPPYNPTNLAIAPNGEA